MELNAQRWKLLSLNIPESNAVKMKSLCCCLSKPSSHILHLELYICSSISILLNKMLRHIKNTWKNKWSPFLAIKEMQIKTTLRFHLTLVRMSTIKNTKNNQCWNYSRNGGGRMKENGRRVEFKYDIFNTL
jgi:hypothetical protein